jgi:hypothetical protein
MGIAEGTNVAKTGVISASSIKVRVYRCESRQRTSLMDFGSFVEVKARFTEHWIPRFKFQNYRASACPRAPTQRVAIGEVMVLRAAKISK